MTINNNLLKNRIWFFLIVAWTLSIGFFFWDGHKTSEETTLALAKEEAVASYNKDLVYRRWAAGHGGVYVPVTETTPPNPYLKQIPERDIITPSGRRLTLINPAYMTRQVFELGREQYGIKGHISSLKPIRPGNAPDPWERKQLLAIENGQGHEPEIDLLEGEQHLRMMFPMVTEKRCLKCHAAQGYRVGDIRGGISVSVPLARFFAAHHRNMRVLGVGDVVLWLLGVGGIFWVRKYANQQFDNLDRMRVIAEASEQKFHLLFAHAPYGSAVADQATGKILDCNRRFLELVGRTEEEIIGQAQTIIHPPAAESAAVSDTFVRHKELPDGTILETQILTKQGDLREVEIKVNRLEFDGRAVMLGFFIDITERKKAGEALKQSEEKFFKAFDNAPIMMMISDVVDGTYLNVNRKFCDISGFSREEIVGESALEITWETSEDRQKLITSLQRDGHVTGIEMPFRRKDGQLLKCSYFGELINVDGQQRLLSLVLDITEQRKLEERLLQAEKLQAIGQLAGGIAHDFNNQLTGVLGYADLLLNRTKDPKLHNFARNIKCSAKRAADLTQQLLAFSRKGRYLSMPVSIPTILNEVVSILEHSIDKRIQISQVLNANPSTVIGDASQLQNALLNIAINARDAMPDGGKLTFETHIAKLDEAFCRSRVEKLVPDRYLVVAISDSGSGIPPAVMQKIFEPFYTTKEIGKGTGMGLASAYGTLRSHHGFIDVVSEVGRGSTFSLYLPLPDRIDSRRAAEADTRPTPGLIPGQGRILLVDDEEMVRSVGREMLQDLGYRVNLCPDGEAGLDYYRQHWREIDLVILDMIMPNRNGRDTFAAMQAINPEILAIFSSGYIIGEQAQSVLREGVRDFMTKPFEQVELSQKIAKVLSG